MKQLFECTIDILKVSVGIKIYEDNGTYSFTQSLYLQDETDFSGVYKPGHGALSKDLEGLLYCINLLINRYTKITKTEANPSF